jgi:integrase
MSEQSLVDVTGRLRSPAATPGHWPGCAPPNKGLRFPADPPTVEEIILVMRQAGPGPVRRPDAWADRVLWRAGLRISEALALTESDLDPKTGSVLVRSGKGGKRRMVGMDDWGWERVARWTEHRVQLPIGPLFCILAGPTRGRGWSATAARGELRRLASQAGVRRRFAPHQLGHAHAIEMAHEGIPLPIIQRQLGHYAGAISPAYPTRAPRDHLDLPPGNRHARDRRHRPSPPTAGDPSERRPAAVTNLGGAGRGAAHQPARGTAQTPTPPLSRFRGAATSRFNDPTTHRVREWSNAMPVWPPERCRPA